MADLPGKRALVTGASRGIDAAIARSPARNGADVAITYEHSAERAAEVVREIDHLGRRGVAIARNCSLETMSLEEIDAVLNVNIRSVVLASQAAIPHLREGGRIINIGSCLAVRATQPGVTAYSMSKSALISFTKGLARDLGPREITVNIVHPGPTHTDMNPANVHI
jgi:3-oxoacyl-[acyl-carrier protein] reductase